MQELKRIGPVSVAKISALFGLFIGLVSVILSKIICSIDATTATQYGMACSTLSWGSALLAILLSAVSYFIAGLIFAAVYNLFVMWVGGIKVDLGASVDKVSKKKK